MSHTEPTLLVVASDRRELEVIGRVGSSIETEKSYPPQSALMEWRGEVVLLTTHGPGRKNAGHATRWACDRFPIRAYNTTGSHVIIQLQEEVDEEE